MFDIHFYQKVFDIKNELMNKRINDKDHIWSKFEEFRSREPVIYNIETTNACNMRCEMCPRTTMMTRSIETMDDSTFKRIIEQIKPFTSNELKQWEEFVEAKYNVSKDEMSENHFFLHIIPKVLVLHGYGDPLLDKNMPKRVELLSEMEIPSYFSCNPANINIPRTIEMFRNGLGYIKYSLESTDDKIHKEIRGKESNFSEAYKKICEIFELKEKHNLKTIIVITMLDLLKPWQAEEFEKLKTAFDGMDIYLYLKSQDQQWYQSENHGTKSIHWLEICQFPWSSMTIKSNGEAVMCVEDFNNEIILGDARKQTLSDIWNGDKYTVFRQQQFQLEPGIKCTEQCDMKLVGNFLLKGN